MVSFPDRGRSHFLVPYISSQLTFTSNNQGLDCEYYLEERIPYTEFEWRSISQRSLETRERGRRSNIEIVKAHHPSLFRHWRGCGVTVGETLLGQRRIRMSYWWVITPLTLLSAFLLLSKPVKKTAEPPANDGV